MKILKGFLLHICAVCSFVCIFAGVLDWYNPFMNFTGHVQMMQMILYLAVILLVLTERFMSALGK